MVPDMRNVIDVIEATSEMIERTKTLLKTTDDRLRLSRHQLEQSRLLIDRFLQFETTVKRRSKA